MADFVISNEVLEKLCKINQFKISNNVELIFVGIRGSVSINFNEQQFKATHTLSTNDINYINPRCTILQWKVNDGKSAAFPASTVPHLNNIKKAKSKGGVGTNCLFTGYYTDYRKGTHKSGKPSGHEAFQQSGIRPIQRSTDDLDYDVDDRVNYENPGDNLHCGWFGNIDSNTFASAGCQVIMGYPKCQRPGRDVNTGPWKIFHENTYNLRQQSFPYILLNGMEVMNVANNPNKKFLARLRFGSSGDSVKAIQNALKKDQFYEGVIDGEFGERTMKAVIAFQKSQFDTDGADGIVGQITAEAMGVSLPSF